MGPMGMFVLGERKQREKKNSASSDHFIVLQKSFSLFGGLRFYITRRSTLKIGLCLREKYAHRIITHFLYHFDHLFSFSQEKKREKEREREQ